MNNIKRVHPASFKAKVALEVIKEIESITQVCSRYSIHPTQAKQWKQQLLGNVENIFSSRAGSELQAKNDIIDELYKQIGQLKVELDWLKKKLSV
jgi:transposase